MDGSPGGTGAAARRPYRFVAPWRRFVAGALFGCRRRCRFVLYSCVVFVVMNFVVIPLSAARLLRITWVNMVDGFAGHIIADGLPCRWIVRATDLQESAAA